MRRMRRLGVILSLCILISTIFPVAVHAVGGRVVIECETSAGIGEELAVTVRCLDSADSMITGNIRFEYNSEKFQFVSCDTAGATTGDGVVNVTGRNVVITLKAISGTEAIVTAYATDEAGNELTAAGVGITLQGAGVTDEPEEGTESDDSLLSDLTIEGVAISPTFQSDVTEYTATVSYETDSLMVDARTADEDAHIVSITGASVLEIGENRIEIIVEAQNGDRTTYTVMVTRLEEGASIIGGADGNGNATIAVGREVYLVSSEYSREMLQAGFRPVEIMINEVSVTGLRYQDTSIIILHLIEESTGEDAGYYVYDAHMQTVCPYVGYGNSDGSEVDRLEKVQANYEKLYKKYESIKQRNRNMLIGIIVGIAALAVVLINVLIFRNLNRRAEYDVDYKDTDGGEPLKKQGEYLSALANNSRGSDEELSEQDISNDIDIKVKTQRVKDDSNDVEVIDLEDL